MNLIFCAHYNLIKCMNVFVGLILPNAMSPYVQASTNKASHFNATKKILNVSLLHNFGIRNHLYGWRKMTISRIQNNYGSRQIQRLRLINSKQILGSHMCMPIFYTVPSPSLFQFRVKEYGVGVMLNYQHY